jgi:hypothetical protein
MERRHLVSGGLLAGLAGAFGFPSAAGAQQRRDESDERDQRTAAAVDELRKVVDRGLQVSPELARIREQQRIFMRANQKFPDYIEVGLGVWESVYDWHVRHQRPVLVGRTTDGRYTMTVMETLLLLRPEQAESFVGFGFDVR